MAEDEATKEEEAFILGRTPFGADAIRAFTEHIVEAMRHRVEPVAEERPIVSA
jgi:hypothetical protein